MSERSAAPTGAERTITGDGRRGVDSHAGSVLTLAAAMLRIGVRWGLFASIAALVVAAGFAGWSGVIGAAVGVSVGFVSSLFTIALMRMVAAMPVAALLGAVLGGYTLKMAALLLVAAALQGVEAVHPIAFGLSVLSVVVTWAAAEMVAFRRTPIPTIIPD